MVRFTKLKSRFPQFVRTMPRSSRRASRRPVRRRATAVRRHRRRQRRRPTLSRRRVLNITSRKKHDNMLTWIPSDPTNPAGSGAAGNLTLSSSSEIVTYNLFCPSARQLDADGTTDDEPQARSAQNTYARGYRETSTIRTNGPAPLRFRRIVFSIKGLPARLLQATGNLLTADFYRLYTSFGYVRQTTSLGDTFAGQINNILFNGVTGQDWFSPFNAKVDTSRARIHSDRTYNVNAGSSGGTCRVLKHWYGLNKSLVYNDDEAGITVDTSEFSTQAKPGMGDVFVYDIYQMVPTAGSDPTTTVAVNHEGTYYWHER